MELTQAQLARIQSLTTSSATTSTDKLANGQQVTAKVTAYDSKTSEVTIKINDVEIKIKTDIALKIDQRLQLLVAKNSADKITLQLIDPVKTSDAAQIALREALPKQTPLIDTLIKLKLLISNSKQNPLPDKISRYISKVIDQLPTSKTLQTAEGVKRAIVQSGIFLESKLLLSQSNSTKLDLQTDVKVMFLRLKSMLNKQLHSELTQTKSSKKSAPLSEKSPLNERLIDLIKNAPSSTLAKNTKTDSAIIAFLKNKTAGLSSIAKATTLTTDTLNTTKPTQQPSASLQNDVVNQQTKSILESIKSQRQNIAENLVKNSIKTNSNSLPGNPSIIHSQLMDEAIANKLSNIKQTTLDNALEKVLTNVLLQKFTSKKTLGQIVRVTTLPTSSLSSMASTALTSNLQKTTLSASTSPYLNQQKSEHTLNSSILTPVKSMHLNETRPTRVTNMVELLETLIKQVDSAISRTQMHQVHTIQEQESGKMVWNIEIPVNDDEKMHLVQMQIEKQASNGDDADAIVTVNLSLNLDRIGAVFVRITLIDKNVGVVFWAEQKETFALARSNLENLQENLEKSGLHSEQIQCHHGQPPQNQRINIDNNNALLDVRA